MKRVIAAALCALLLLGLCPVALAEEGEAPVTIGSRADLLRIADDPAGSYELTDDIDMGGEPWVPLAFSGKLDGHGHTLYNLTVTAPGPDRTMTYDGNRKEYDTVFGGLFSVVKNAEIRELNLISELERFSEEEELDVTNGLQRGERVKFTGGAFAGWEGVVLSVDGKDGMAYINITSIESSVRLKYPAAWCEIL